jgi:hypothetical protein
MVQAIREFESHPFRHYLIRPFAPNLISFAIVRSATPLRKPTRARPHLSRGRKSARFDLPVERGTAYAGTQHDFLDRKELGGFGSL